MSATELDSVLGTCEEKEGEKWVLSLRDAMCPSSYSPEVVDSGTGSFSPDVALLLQQAVLLGGESVDFFSPGETDPKISRVKRPDSCCGVLGDSPHSSEIDASPIWLV